MCERVRTELLPKANECRAQTLHWHPLASKLGEQSRFYHLAPESPPLSR